MRFTLSALAGAAGMALMAMQPAHAECGRITIADMNWASAEFAAYIDKFILAEGYGCDVELVPGDTMPTSTSMSTSTSTSTFTSTSITLTSTPACQ